MPHMFVRSHLAMRTQRRIRGPWGWRFGTRSMALRLSTYECLIAQANLAKIPDELTDEQVVLLADLASTGFGGAEARKHPNWRKTIGTRFVSSSNHQQTSFAPSDWMQRS